MRRLAAPLLLLAIGAPGALLPTAARAQGAKAAPSQWKAPARAQNPGDWSELLGELSERRLHFGVVLAAQRMLGLFQDAPTREVAYRALVAAVDRGYPFSVISSFGSGEINLVKRDRFASTYYTYRAVLAERAGNPKWAEDAWRRVEIERTPAALFHRGRETYLKGDLGQTRERMSQILALIEGRPEERPHAAKAARTLARVLYEEKRYAEALSVYRDFLLRLNPVAAGDFLEAAWAAFQLKEHALALGYLYNLESASTRSEHLLEKYLLRGLIHRALCAEPQIRVLLDDFNSSYRGVLEAVRRGQSFARLPVLREILTPRAPEFAEVTVIRRTLEEEELELSGLSSKSRRMAGAMYAAEIKRLEKREAFLMPAQANAAAEQLLTVAKSLDFLRFELERSRFRPELAFRKDPDVDLDATADLPPEPGLLATLPLAWKQAGEFWRQERLTYRARIEGGCGQ